MDTHFAPAERADERQLVFDIDLVSESTVVSSLLHAASGVLAILNEQRQVLAVNDSFLRLLGIDDPQTALGLRPGEVLQCAHSEKGPSGCGTTEYCASCGAAVAMVACLEENRPIEKVCALAAERGSQSQDLFLMVRAHPLVIDGRRFILLFLQDITKQQQRAVLERTFFHDINNLLGVLSGASELLVDEDPSDLSKTIHTAAFRLQQEVAIQRCLMQGDAFTYQPMWHRLDTGRVLSEIEAFFANHPAACHKTIELAKTHSKVAVTADVSLLSRVLCNMVVNALEASGENDAVKIWTECGFDTLSFCVWNRQFIPPQIANRIFQRNFTTKEQSGRGIGTYSMKLFGEKILGGSVGFSTVENEGTVFRLTLPLKRPEPE